MKKYIQVSLRMPPALHEQVVEAAAHDDRSLNTFILRAIEDKLKRGNWLDDEVLAAQKGKDNE